MSRMRQSLRHHLRRAACSRSRAPRLLLHGARALAAAVGARLPAPLGGPLLATFAITWRCPLACAMCDLPSRAGREIDDAAIPAWIDAIAALRPAGLGFTGGEPLVRKVVLPAIERAAGHGLVVHLNTSGTGLTPAVAERLVGAGLSSVNVSLDHDRDADHDRLRGRRGSRRAALAALEALAAARDRAGARGLRDLRIQAMMAVSAETVDRVGDVERLAREHGADCLSILPVHDLVAPASAWPADDAVANGLRRTPLENSRAYVEGTLRFLAGEKTPGTCSAPRSGLFLDPTGRVYACTPAATVGDAATRGIAATPDTLASIVHAGLESTVPEGRCERCWWNCHRELDLAIGRGGLRGWTRG